MGERRMVVLDFGGAVDTLPCNRHYRADLLREMEAEHQEALAAVAAYLAAHLPGLESILLNRMVGAGPRRTGTNCGFITD